jgi:hypothetical protein
VWGERERERVNGEERVEEEGVLFLVHWNFKAQKVISQHARMIVYFFFKEHVDKEECPTCKTSRWANVKSKGKKIPHKVLQYFPIKPRLQRLFMSKDITKDMRWHKDGRQDDENLRHPANLILWKEFD